MKPTLFAFAMLGSVGLIVLVSDTHEAHELVTNAQAAADIFCARQGMPNLRATVNLTVATELYDTANMTTGSPVLVDPGNGAPGSVGYAAPADRSIRYPYTCATWYADYYCATQGYATIPACMEHFYSLDDPCAVYLDEFYGGVDCFLFLSALDDEEAMVKARCSSSPRTGTMVASSVDAIRCTVDPGLIKGYIAQLSPAGASAVTHDATEMLRLYDNDFSSAVVALGCT
jgi:hypothetical protein